MPKTSMDDPIEISSSDDKIQSDEPVEEEKDDLNEDEVINPNPENSIVKKETTKGRSFKNSQSHH